MRIIFNRVLDKLFNRKISGIYEIQNTQNGLTFIGVSNDVRQCIYHHIISLHENEHSNTRLQNDYNLYGLECFEFEIIKRIKKMSQQERESKEMQVLSNYKFSNRLYNKVN